MLTGLLFAIEEAVDDPARLVATLPFAGTTVIEHQARQVISAGAGHIVVIGERHSPELLGALHRIGRRGVPVDAVFGASEAAATLHPLARVVMLADGLVTTDAVVRLLAGEGDDALLVLPADEAPAGLERIGGATAWAGAARFDAQRLGDLAQLPADYDPQSTLVRLAEAAGSTRLPLPAAALHDGHGIDRDIASLALRGRRIVTAAAPAGRDWFDRYLVAPLVRTAMPLLIARNVETIAIAGTTGVLGAGCVIALVADWPRLGLFLAMAAVLLARVGIAVATLRDEEGWQRGMRAGVKAIAAVAVLLLGWRCSAVGADGTALVVAVALIAAVALIERAGALPSIWWGGAGPCLLLATVATLLDRPVVGLELAAVYAGVTLAAAIDALRRGLAPL